MVVTFAFLVVYAIILTVIMYHVVKANSRLQKDKERLVNKYSTCQSQYFDLTSALEFSMRGDSEAAKFWIYRLVWPKSVTKGFEITGAIEFLSSVKAAQKQFEAARDRCHNGDVRKFAHDFHAHVKAANDLAANFCSLLEVNIEQYHEPIDMYVREGNLAFISHEADILSATLRSALSPFLDLLRNMTETGVRMEEVGITEDSQLGFALKLVQNLPERPEQSPVENDEPADEEDKSDEK